MSSIQNGGQLLLLKGSSVRPVQSRGSTFIHSHDCWKLVVWTQCSAREKACGPARPPEIWKLAEFTHSPSLSPSFGVTGLGWARMQDLFKRILPLFSLPLSLVVSGRISEYTVLPFLSMCWSHLVTFTGLRCAPFLSYVLCCQLI